MKVPWIALVFAAGMGGAAPAVAECLAFGRDVAQVWTTRALEDRVAAHLLANERRFGGIDWPCLRHAFSVLSETTSVEVIRGRGVGGGDVYRFSVDRSGNPLARLGSASNGVFVAIVNSARDGRVALIRRGGEAEWLGF